MLEEKKDTDLSHTERLIKQLLGFMRNPNQRVYYKGHLTKLSENLKDGSELKKFGVEEEEFDKLVCEGALASAKLNIQSLRSGMAKNIAARIKDLEQDLEYGNLSLAQIGTSENELDSFRLKINTAH